MPRKRSISALLNESSKKNFKKTKVTCNCDECDGLLVDSRTEFSHRYRKSKKETMMKKEFIFQPKTRSIRQNKILSLGDYQQNPIRDISSNEDIFENDGIFGESFEELDDLFEDYSAPDISDFEPLLNSNKFTDTDSRFMWILLWIMNFRIRFNLSDTATEALLKFMKLVLIEIGGNEFENFCGSLYIAKKFLGLSDQFVSFVACQKCHKLYKRDDILNFQQNNRPSIMKCVHVEFPNSATRRKYCNTPLSTQSKLLNGNIINRPEMIFPYAKIRQQLAQMYRNPGFEFNLRHWVNRSNFDELLCDIYDGNIWKTFEDGNSKLFFSKEAADSHLGLVLNIDWFQPYDNKTHSTGVIYAAIANLPREIRFRRENMLILGILLGPSEPSLHRMNHYLSPIVDELMEL
jgi:Transposase family tnp2